MTAPSFDGHLPRDFAAMTPEERLEDVCRRARLLVELARSRQAPGDATKSDVPVSIPRR